MPILFFGRKNKEFRRSRVINKSRFKELTKNKNETWIKIKS